MTKPSAPPLTVNHLSEVGQALVRLKNDVIYEWERRIRAELSGARDLTHPILVDTIPPYLDNLAEALTPGRNRLDATDSTTIAQEHGGERARMTFYDPDELIREYHVLRDVIFERLSAAVRLTREDRLVIHQSIDSSLREAVTAFALIQSDVRQQFTATLTHDLRNPIGVIRMAAELVMDEVGDNEMARSLLVRILNNAKRADAMIQDLLDTTTFKVGGRLSLDLSNADMLELVHHVVKELSLSHGERFRVEGGSVRGCWGVDALRRALENLCNNAIKYGDKHAPVTIRVGETHGRVIVSVHNEGRPIPAAEQEAIFQVFRRAYSAKTDYRQKGWGLGLALARGVAESHGGSLAVDSKEGRGTTFLIDIPCDATPFQGAPIA